MILDDLQQIKSIDEGDMYGKIQGLPDQLLTSWNKGQQLPLPQEKEIKQILIAGMGASAIGADLAAAYAAPTCPVPIFVLRDYDLPAWATGSQTLVIACSYSGDTEETVSAFSQAQERGCSRIAISNGGKISEMARAANVPFWKPGPSRPIPDCGWALFWISSGYLLPVGSN